MHFILQDGSKFKNLGPSIETVYTGKIEAHIQRRLLQLEKEGLLPSKIHNKIRPTGSQRPRMYGLPKIRKQDVPYTSHFVYDWFSTASIRAKAYVSY